MLVATYVSFGLAVLCGVYLSWLAGPGCCCSIGAASILAGVLYTGGPRPYGYEGLGEVFVFLFFGIVAVTGSYFVQTEQLTWEAFVLAVPVGPARQRRSSSSTTCATSTPTGARASARSPCGSAASARGRCTRLHGLRRLRDRAGCRGWRRRCRRGCCCRWLPLPLAVPLVRTVRTRTDGPRSTARWRAPGMLQLAFCVLLAAGLLLS